MKRGIIGAVIGDIVGSRFERDDINPKSTDFDLFTSKNRFTDDTVLTVAVADWLMTGGDIAAMLRKWGHKYPFCGFGPRFRQWLYADTPEPCNSYGNGSAMRVSPIGFRARTLEEAAALAERSAEVTHNHPLGLTGAKATATAIFLARTGASKDEIRNCIERDFDYDLRFGCDLIRPKYRFNVTCQGTCPHAIAAFLDSTDYESAIRLAVSLGGDSDTLACIAGGIAAAFYGVPDNLTEQAMEYLPYDLAKVICRFDNLPANTLRRYTPERIVTLEPDEIFVFGSNPEGDHRGGAALTALRHFGARTGQGVGLQGQSYAIPTMLENAEAIKPHVDEFTAFATRHPELTFYVTRIGCGIAGFDDAEIAPLFDRALEIENIVLPRSFVQCLQRR